ncbi:hypothetical protein [Rubrivirga sp. IMCC45206]|uniref:hypothetical protein n=1 Tax=Rubrivirga sp. IMCC45206 TaxID=3391614 RepID=UPI0039902C0F
MRRAALLLCLVALGGCVFGDCAFESSRTVTTGGLLVADGRAVGDTLTLAFVADTGPGIRVSVADSALVAGVTPDGAVEVLYDATAIALGGDVIPRPLVATVVGDTAYVYVAGTLDLVTQVCSPPDTAVDLLVREVLLPDGVVGRTAVISRAEVPVAVADAAARARRASLVRA